MHSQKIKDTLFLPKTNFSLRNLDHQRTEVKIRQKWKDQRVYQKFLENNQNNSAFILHDGPTYANDKIHIGHALNHILKDIIVRFYALQGYYTPFVLGWDTHGLPIEHKVLQLFPDKRADLRKKCDEYASQQVEIQKKQLEQLGLFTDYDQIYLTKDKKYVAEQIRIFGEMVKKGLIYQGLRPIHWSCSHETALAEAEIEYLEKKDTSLYFKIKLAENFFGKENVSLLVWTTQPWTIPANQLIAVKKTASYALINHNNEYLLILESKVYLLEKWEKNVKVEKTFLGKELLDKYYNHPYRKDIKGYIIDGSDFIEEGEGTGIVHLAPAFGAEDFAIAKKEKLAIECPLESNGTFNEQIRVTKLVGKHYSEVNNYVIADLEKRNLIVKKEVISHSYPHDWRDKSPLIYRLTKQWFIKIEAIKKELLENITKVKWYPAWTQEKIKSAISAREDWCISRQRKWGVPIPVLYKNNKPMLNTEIINYVANIFAEKGSDCWFNGNILSFLREKFPSLVDKDTVLGSDIMDVWLDSGISHWCVLKKNVKMKL
jgi:isoleucyl-tRNA synthetase